MKCIVCNTEYEAKRATSKFCSATCRSKANRSVATVKDNATLTVTLKPLKPIEEDYTREMVEQRLRYNPNDNFKPNWYLLGLPSKNAAKEHMGWNKLLT